MLLVGNRTVLVMQVHIYHLMVKTQGIMCALDLDTQ